MPLTINVKRDAQSAREAVKRNGKSTFPWYCGCDGRRKRNPRYLVKCPVCKMRQEDCERADD